MHLSQSRVRYSRLGLIGAALALTAALQSVGSQDSGLNAQRVGAHSPHEDQLHGVAAHDHSRHNHSYGVAGTSRASKYGRSDVGEHWRTLYESPEATTDVSAEQLLAAAVSPSIVQGDLRVLVINVATPTRLATPFGPLSDAYARAANLMNVISRGRAVVKVDIFPRVVVVPDVTNLCRENGVMSTAALNMVNAETSTDGYRSIDFILPVRSGDNCWWAGMANLLGRFSWNMATEERPPSPFTIVHEWGHQYSLAHLKAIRCTKDGVDVQFVDRQGRGSGQCAVEEYGGAFSVMGGVYFDGPQIFTSGERGQLGWLRPEEQRVAYDGTFTLGVDGPISLLWLQNAEGDLFQVEYVQKNLADSSGYFWDPFSRKYYPIALAPEYSQSGVMVKYLSTYSAYAFAPSGYLLEGFVIDATPQTIYSTDAAFRAGNSFVDPTGSLVIEVLSVDATSAQVKVRGIPFRPNQVQGVAATPTDVRGVFDLTFTPVASDPPVTHYEVQAANNYAMKNSITVTVPSPGRVTIPNFNETFMVYRIAAVNIAGRGEFSSGFAKLQWPSNAKTQDAAGMNRPKEAAQSLKCKKGNRTRVFVADSCPVGWTKI